MFSYFGPLLRQYLVVITMNLSVLSTGMGLVWPSPVLVKLRNATENVLPRPITEDEGSWIVSISFLNGIGANILAAFLIDRIGRKYTIFLPCVLRVASGFLFLFARQVWMILLGRAIQGAADACIFTVLPMYASEVASKEVRGSLGTILQIICSFGVVFMLCVGPITSYVTLNIIFTVVLIVTTLPLGFLPDSPYFLYSKGRNEEALQVLTFFRGSETIAREELKSYAASTKTDVKIKELFTNRTFLKSFGIVLVLAAGLQLSGFNVVSFYLQSILESTQTSVRPELASAVIGLIQIFASFCTTAVTDRFGRIPILATTLSGLAVGMLGMGTFFFFKNSAPIGGGMNYVPLVSLILITFSYSAGLGSINWVLSAELFDDHSRGTGLAITAVISYILVFVCSKYFPFLLLTVGPACTYWFFSVCCVLFCLFVMFCIPETKGKTFAEIQTALGAKSSEDDVEKSRF